MSDLREDAGSLVVKPLLDEKSETNDHQSNQANSDNNPTENELKVVEPVDLIRQRLADQTDNDAIERLKQQKLSDNQSDNQADNVTERSGDNRSDRLSDRFDFELNSDNQSNSSILDDFNHLKLSESTDKSFGRHENFYLNEKDTASDTLDPSDGLNRSVNKGQLEVGSCLSESSNNPLDERQSDYLAEPSDNHQLHNHPHRPPEILATNQLSDQPSDQPNISAVSHFGNTDQAGLGQGSLVMTKAGTIATVVSRDALDADHQSGHSRSSSSASSQDKALVEKLRTELSRLKQHLIQIEEDYTNELVEVQQREASLEQQLIKANAEVEQLTHRLNNTGPLVAIRAQAEQALDERDQVLQRCSKLEDEVQRSQASLANLQLVIERMQKEHDQRLQTANKLHEQGLMEERRRHSQLENEINKYQLKLKESNAALQAASRLSQQLHAKQETIDQLRIHLQKKEELVNRLHDEIDQLNSSAEGKVDKQFIKNLVVGYFKADDKKQDVARLLARVLDFNELEMRQAGVQLNTSGSSTGFDPHVHRRQGSASSTASSSYATDANESITQQFVHFLEEESKVHRVPVAKRLAADLSKVVSPPVEPIKATNLISPPSTFPSLSSSFVSAGSVAPNLATASSPAAVDTPDVASVGSASQPEIRPMLIPNSAIMNAQLSKLSLNNGSKPQFSSKPPPSSATASAQQQPNSSGSQPASDHSIKPVVLNIPNSFNNFHNDTN